MRRALVFLVALAALAGTAGTAGTADAAHGLQTAIFDPETFRTDTTGLAFKRTRATGATMVRLMLDWADVAPRGPRPEGFNPSDPLDPKYKWKAFDAQVARAAAAGLAPIVAIAGIPDWAQRARGVDGAGRPDPRELAAFASVAAQRFNGGDPARPRIRHWQIWNEPNISVYLSPQEDGTKLVSAGRYRQMVNLAAKAIHAVKRDNVVIAGGLSPFTRTTGPVDAIGPLRFMRQLFLRPVEFDVWAHHPYTSGGPTHGARSIRTTSRWATCPRCGPCSTRPGAPAASRRRSGLRFWVTEFSWDTNKPDPNGVPLGLHARWTAEALYRMWRAGVSLVTWFTLRDSPFA